LHHFININAEYCDAKSLPSGTEVEVFDCDVLRDISNLSRDSSGTEYLTWYVTHNQGEFNQTSLPIDPKYVKDYRLTLDHEKDYYVIEKLLCHMKDENRLFEYTLDDIIKFMESNPDLISFNKIDSYNHDKRSIDTRLQFDIK